LSLFFVGLFVFVFFSVNKYVCVFVCVLPSNGKEVAVDLVGKPKDAVRVTMVSWNQDDTRVITAISDKSIKVWDSNTSTLLHVLKVGDIL
jgi:WD40 repeat protein